MIERYKIVRRVFKGNVMMPEVVIESDIETDDINELMFFMNYDAKNENKSKELQRALTEGISTEIDFGRVDVITGEDSVTISSNDGSYDYTYPKDEVSLIFSDLIKTRELTGSFNEKPRRIVPVKRIMMNVKNEFRDTRADEIKVSYPLLHRTGNDIDIQFFILKLSQENIDKKECEAPDVIVTADPVTGEIKENIKSDIDSGILSLDFPDEGYTNAYLDSILDLFDTARITIGMGSYDKELYKKYLDSLYEIVPESFKETFKKLDIKDDDIPGRKVTEEDIEDLEKDIMKKIPEELKRCYRNYDAGVYRDGFILMHPKDIIKYITSGCTGGSFFNGVDLPFGIQNGDVYTISLEGGLIKRNQDVIFERIENLTGENIEEE